MQSLKEMSVRCLAEHRDNRTEMSQATHKKAYRCCKATVEKTPCKWTVIALDKKQKQS